MNKTKLFITFMILFITIGIAAVATSMAIDGSTLLAGNMDDFKVYFSNFEETSPNPNSNVQILTKRTLSFQTRILDITDIKRISFDVTNASQNYDAEVSLTCEGTNEYVNLSYDLTDTIPARSTKTGTIELSLLKTYAGEEDFLGEITCTLNANAIERTSLETAPVPEALLKKYEVGEEVVIDTEKFNVISSTEDTVTLLAQTNIDNYAPNKQTSEQMQVKYSEEAEWEYGPDPTEIDVKAWNKHMGDLLRDYENTLKNEYNINATANVITLKELGELGCNVSTTYAWDEGGWNCTMSPHSDWLINGQYWWTRSVSPYSPENIWFVSSYGSLYMDSGVNNGLRPMITVNKEDIEVIIKYDHYYIGEQITISNENFNVISQTLETVTLLAEYNLGTDYRQTSVKNEVMFTDKSGWEYTPGPKEIDIQTWSTNPKVYINNYVSYLRSTTGDNTITGDLLTLEELGRLGCTISEDYSWGVGAWTCLLSQHKDWLVKGQSWWTRSADSEHENNIWFITDYGDFYYDAGHPNGVRPIITISKKTIKVTE